MGEPVLELRGATRLYPTPSGVITALAGVDLTLAQGTFAIVTGRSGSGKSSLLAVAGLLTRPTAGQVRLFGADTANLDDAARSRLRAERLGFVFQFAGLLPTLTVFDNVRLPSLFRPPAADGHLAEALRARELLRRVGLGDRLNAFPHELSGGEQRRVAIARALVGRPAILLADEPTGDLDRETEAGILKLLQELHAGGLTIILVTHHLELKCYATHWLQMSDGRLAAAEP